MVDAMREEESEKKLLLALYSETCYKIMSLDSISVSQILLAACQKKPSQSLAGHLWAGGCLKTHRKKIARGPNFRSSQLSRSSLNKRILFNTSKP